MAKKYNNRQQQSEKKVVPNWGKFWIGLICFVLVAAVLVCVTGWRTKGFNDWTFGFGNNQTEMKDPADNDGENEDNEGNNGNASEDFTGSVIEDSNNNGIKLLSAKLPREAFKANGVSEQADSAYTLTAEVFPDYASDKLLDWSVSWRNSESEFSRGKVVTEYVTVTPTADGAFTAICACLKDFGESVTITVSSRSNPEVFCTVTVDYYQRVKSLNYIVKLNGENTDFSADDNGVIKVDYTGEKKNYTVDIVPVYSNYTLTDSYVTEINGSFASNFGYTATLPFTSLELPAGLSGGDPEMSENALNWCHYVERIVFSYTTTSNMVPEGANIGLGLAFGEDIYAFGQKLVPEYKLTAEEKTHPRCAYYLSILPKGSFTDVEEYNRCKTQFSNYKPSAYTFMGNVTVTSYNDFVNAVKKCNTAKSGIVQYSITINGTYSNYTTTLKLGYNDEFKIVVSDINMSDTNIGF